MKQGLREIEQKYKVPANWDCLDLTIFDNASTVPSEGGLMLNWYYEPVLEGIMANQSWRLRGWPADKARRVQLVIKQGADPINGRDRLEHTIELPYTNIELAEANLLSLGIVKVQSKWARHRRCYAVSKDGANKTYNATICVDRNYGHDQLVEIEAGDAATLDFFAELIGLEPLEDKELAIWYKNVMTNWQDYYDTFINEELANEYANILL